MKTIIHLELTDEQRALFNNTLCKKGLVSRKEVIAWVEDAVHRLLSAQEINNEHNEEEPTTAKPPAFIPSRGDEAYLTRPADTGLAATCSRILDDVAVVEAFAWETIERNKKP